MVLLHQEIIGPVFTQQEAIMGRVVAVIGVVYFMVAAGGHQGHRGQEFHGVGIPPVEILVIPERLVHAVGGEIPGMGGESLPPVRVFFHVGH